MKTLLFYGSEADYQLSMLVNRYLKKRSKLMLINRNNLLIDSTDCEYQLIDKNNLSRIQGNHVAVFLKHKCNLKSLKSISNNTVLLLSSSNKRHREFVSRSGGRAVTYGLSSKDTVTFSSRSENDFVVSLQRSVMTISGRVLEPLEIPCRTIGKCSNATILAFVSILLILDALDGREEEPLIIDCSIFNHHEKSK